jgi:crotonobetainyl-CoA:carnitine CoA-transferase CaiB-like acyl-CoA transferase
MSRTECKVRGPAPLMGQHNDEVLTGLLGYSTDEVAQMRSRGALD